MSQNDLGAPCCVVSPINKLFIFYGKKGPLIILAVGMRIEKSDSNVVISLNLLLYTWYQNLSKKNLNAPRPSEHPPLRGKMSKRLGGIIGCKYKTSSWHLNGFPDGSNIESTG